MLWWDFDIILTEDYDKSNLTLMGFMYARISIATSLLWDLWIYVFEVPGSSQVIIRTDFGRKKMQVLEFWRDTWLVRDFIDNQDLKIRVESLRYNNNCFVEWSNLTWKPLTVDKELKVWLEKEIILKRIYYTKQDRKFLIILF